VIEDWESHGRGMRGPVGGLVCGRDYASGVRRGWGRGSVFQKEGQAGSKCGKVRCAVWIVDERPWFGWAGSWTFTPRFGVWESGEGFDLKRGRECVRGCALGSGVRKDAR